MAPVKGCCDFCGRPSNDILYGPLHRKRDIKCHYYCLLFSSTLDQKGRDDEGILGFLLPDIRKELEKGSKLNCSYCHRPGAVSKCFHRKCKKRFHLPCGMERGSLHLFFSEFRSYCGIHRSKQKVPAEILNSRDVNCSICFDPVEDLNSNDSIWAPCCKKNGWFHRLCLQKFALNAAYFFKCPLCASQRKFRDAMLRNGIYIPDQDASWELEPNAFAELLERHQQCDAAVCKCPRGRKFSSESSRLWNLMLCRNCASKGSHIGCIPGPRSSLERRSIWDCSDCNPVVKAQRQSQGGEIVSVDSMNSDYNEEEGEEEIIVVDDEPESNEASSYKSSFMTNFGLASPNVRKILSNVIHLKSKSAELIDLVKDESEQMEVVVSDDEDPFPLDDKDKSSTAFKSEILSDKPQTSVINEESTSIITDNQSSPRLLESSLAFRHEVGNPSFSPASQSGGVTRREILSRRDEREYLWAGVRNFSDRNFKGNTKTALSCYNTKENTSTKHRHHSGHYFGLRSGSLERKRKSCRNKKHCLMCKKMFETYAGRIYDNLLVDGWSEILNGMGEMSPDKTSNKIGSPQEFPGKICRNPTISSCSTYNKDIYKLFWLKSAKWVCGATSCLSVLRHRSLESNVRYCNEPSKYGMYRNVEFGSTRKTEKQLKLGPDRYGISIKELIGMLKL